MPKNTSLSSGAKKKKTIKIDICIPSPSSSSSSSSPSKTRVYHYIADSKTENPQQPLELWIPSSSFETYNNNKEKRFQKERTVVVFSDAGQELFCQCVLRVSSSLLAVPGSRICVEKRGICQVFAGKVFCRLFSMGEIMVPLFSSGRKQRWIPDNNISIFVLANLFREKRHLKSIYKRVYQSRGLPRRGEN